MVPNPSSETLATDPRTVQAELPTPFTRIRLRFEKSGPFRWLSHHDLIRAVDRLLRRLGLPVVHSQGFHPQPAIVFGLSLPLGATGVEEVLEIDLEGLGWDPNDLLLQIQGQSPPGLIFRSSISVGPKARARVKSLEYRVEIPEALRDIVSARMAEILASPVLMFDRSGPASAADGNDIETAIPSKSAKDYRKSLDYLRFESRFLEIGLLPQLDGTVKPTELLARLGWPIDSEEYPQPQLQRSQLTLEDDPHLLKGQDLE